MKWIRKEGMKNTFCASVENKFSIFRFSLEKVLHVGFIDLKKKSSFLHFDEPSVHAHFTHFVTSSSFK